MRQERHKQSFLSQSVAVLLENVVPYDKIVFSTITPWTVGILKISSECPSVVSSIYLYCMKPGVTAPSYPSLSSLICFNMRLDRKT